MTLASRLLLFTGLILVLTISCTQPVTLGSDFLEDEKSDLKFTDDFSLTFHTEKTDSIVTHYGDNASYQLSTYLCGNIQDPIFGRSTAEIYATPLLPTVGTNLLHSFLDSVVLVMRYDTNGNYGDITQPVTMEVFQLTETPNYKLKYFSNDRFAHDPQPLATLTFTPHTKDSLIVITPGDTIQYAPHLRVKLDVNRFSSITNVDSTILMNQDTFLDYFHGIYVRLTGATNTMLGFNLLNSLSGIVFYYDPPGEEDHKFQLLFTSLGVNTVYMEHDYTGSPVGDALGPDAEIDHWYVQGMSGVATRMSIDDIDKLGNIVVNEADLEFYVTFPDGDNEAYYPPCKYIVAQEPTDTTLSFSDDVLRALAVAGGSYTSPAYSLLFGGKLEERTPGPPVVYRYHMKVTNQVREILRGKKENVIYFNPISKGNIPNRSVLFGPSAPIYAPRLRVYYTEL